MSNSFGKTRSLICTGKDHMTSFQHTDDLWQSEKRRTSFFPSQFTQMLAGQSQVLVIQ